MVIDGATGIGLIGQSQKNERGLKSILEKLATGKKINKASDNAALLSIAKELEKMVRGFDVAENNLGDALGALRISDGAAQSISDMTQRQRELALQSSNGTINQSQRDILNNEFQQLTAEIDRQSQAAQYNGQSLLDGQSALSDGTGSIQAGPNNVPTDQLPLPQADLRAATLGLDTLDISSVGGASAAISGIDAARTQINNVRTNIGSTSNRISHATESVATNRINTASALSRAEDLDFAEGVSEQARQGLLNQTNMAALDNFNDIARNNMLSLLSGL